MVYTDQMLALAAKHQINITLADLPLKIHGFYNTDGYDRSIVINQRIPESGPLYRSILAEELGHHFTTSGGLSPVYSQNYGDQINYDRQELKAVRWATSFLIPTESLLSKIEDGSVRSIRSISKAFCVTEQLVHTKLRFMSYRSLYWPLKGNKQLCLASLPGIYIYDPINPFDW